MLTYSAYIFHPYASPSLCSPKTRCTHRIFKKYLQKPQFPQILRNPVFCYVNLRKNTGVLKIYAFLIKSLAKIAENRVIMAFIVYKG